MKRSGFTRRPPLTEGLATKKRAALKRITPLKKIRRDTVGKLKIKLWQLCRALTIKTHGNTCYSCGANNLSGSNLHTGHFIPSSVSSAELRYSLENLRPQCMVCNVHRSGNWPAYEAHLIRDGIDVEALKRRNQATKGMQADTLWYKGMIETYTALLSEL